MEIDVVIPDRLVHDITSFGFNDDAEGGAWLLFSRSSVSSDAWTNKPRERYILRQVWQLTSEDIDSASSVHLTVKTDSFIPVLKKANEGFVAGFLHGHPSGYDKFSKTDDENEKTLLKAAINRNGSDSKLISLLVLPDGSMRARIWQSLERNAMCKIVSTGSKYRFLNEIKEKIENKNIFDRQLRLFGESFNRIVQEIRVLVVGAGGTGSPLSVMLARAGVRKLATIDPDFIEESNIHRLHGARINDIGESKAVTLAKYINSIGLGKCAVGINGDVLMTEYQNLLKSSDIIFCATDNHASRLLLNRYAYFYETTVIDVGLASSISSSGEIQDITGRVTTIYPGTACLLCRGIIDSERAREEELFRRDPTSHKQQLREGYILGGGDPEPAFISMTTSVATLAIEEFIQLICGFRITVENMTQRFRRFHIPEDRQVATNPFPDCKICGSDENWGLGDVTPFLDRVP